MQTRIAVLRILCAAVIGAASANAAEPAPDEPPPGGALFDEIELMVPAELLPYALEQQAMLEWAKAYQNPMLLAVSEIAEPHDLIVQLAIGREGAEVTVFSRPALDDAVRSRLEQSLATPAPPNSTSIVVPVRFHFVAKDGALDGEYDPPLVSPTLERLEGYWTAGAAEQLATNQAWARHEILPLLAAMASDVAPRFEGVRAVGTMLGEQTFEADLDVDALTWHKPDYWRAFMEMGPGDRSVSAARIFLLMANGEMDRARRELDIAVLHSMPGKAPDTLLNELEARIDGFDYAWVPRVEAGIALHEAGSYDEAIEQYDILLAEYPQSAWVSFERIFSVRARDEAAGAVANNDDMAFWRETKAAIDRCDPLYAIPVLVPDPEEMFRVYRRAEIKTVFREGSLPVNTADYADMALDAGQYGLAAELYWLALTAGGEQLDDERNLVTHYLYALHRLDSKALGMFFKEEVVATFDTIDEERRTLMEQHPAYLAASHDEEEGQKAGRKSSGKKRKKKK